MNSDTSTNNKLNQVGMFIMGLAEAKIGLRKYISNNKSLYFKLQDVQTVDSITENQKIEKVINYYTK